MSKEYRYVFFVSYKFVLVGDTIGWDFGNIECFHHSREVKDLEVIKGWQRYIAKEINKETGKYNTVGVVVMAYQYFRTEKQRADGTWHGEFDTEGMG